MISEVYVPRDSLTDFMTEVADDFRRHSVEVIYGTIRLIERDQDTFLAWAREPWACVICNLHSVHTSEGIEHAAAAFRRLIDLANDRGGTYFLTYHRWATRQQVERSYPRFREFLALKRRHDPEERFQSDWYRHCRTLFDEDRR
jgi:FAD/FMN-containing dehydrogenase